MPSRMHFSSDVVVLLSIPDWGHSYPTTPRINRCLKCIAYSWTALITNKYGFSSCYENKDPAKRRPETQNMNLALAGSQEATLCSFTFRPGFWPISREISGLCVFRKLRPHLGCGKTKRPCPNSRSIAAPAVFVLQAIWCWVFRWHYRPLPEPRSLRLLFESQLVTSPHLKASSDWLNELILCSVFDRYLENVFEKQRKAWKKAEWSPSGLRGLAGFGSV